jgi:hypothetical protein
MKAVSVQPVREYGLLGEHGVPLFSARVDSMKAMYKIFEPG